MFTGIIEYQGVVKKKNAARLHIETAPGLIKHLEPGASIAVNGVCLTASTISGKRVFAADVMPETLRRTTLGGLESDSPVNLELALEVGRRLGGHMVQGHIDGTARILGIRKEKNSHIVTVGVPSEVSKYLVKKGSVTINGVALTIAHADKRRFTVGIIPHTWKNTTFHSLSVGDVVNIETDIIAKYVSKLVSIYEK